VQQLAISPNQRLRSGHLRGEVRWSGQIGRYAVGRIDEGAFEELSLRGEFFSPEREAIVD
jgi:hypothetical protein